MPVHRFYVGDRLAGVSIGDSLRLGGDAAHRVRRVLRLGPGDRIHVAGAGRELEAVIEAGGEPLQVRLQAEIPPPAIQPARLTLYQGLIRPNRFEWLIEKGTEVGIVAFVPVLTEYSAVRASEIGAARLERWRRISIEATEQSGGRLAPTIMPPRPFAEALAMAQGRRVIAWEGFAGDGTAAPPPPDGAVPSRPATRTGLRGPDVAAGEELALFIGPEGGFSEGEVARARATGAHVIGLGPRILRAETAALVAAARLLQD